MTVEAISDRRQQIVEGAAALSDRALKAAADRAERALAELTDAASAFYDAHKDDAEEVLRDAGRTVGESVGKAAAAVMAMLPSERRKRRRRRVGMIAGGAIAVWIGLVAFKDWRRRHQIAQARQTSTPSLSTAAYRTQTS